MFLNSRTCASVLYPKESPSKTSGSNSTPLSRKHSSASQVKVMISNSIELREVFIRFTVSFPALHPSYTLSSFKLMLFVYTGPRIFCPGHNPNSAYKRTIHVIQKKAIEEGKTFDEFDDICSRYVEVGELVQKVVGVELTQWLIEKLIWLELCKFIPPSFPHY